LGCDPLLQISFFTASYAGQTPVCLTPDVLHSDVDDKGSKVASAHLAANNIAAFRHC